MKLIHNSQPQSVGEPFDSVEECWFWFVAANNAKNEGARYGAGLSTIIRPCEPADILSIMDRLFRSRQITIEHLKVLKHYGERSFGPDKHQRRERRSFYRWKEAMDKLRPVLERKAIVKRKTFNFFEIRNGDFTNHPFNTELQGAF